jgi:urease accessory protein
MRPMFAASSLSDITAGPETLPRVDGGICVTFRNRNGLTTPRSYFERDGYRLRFPRGGEGCEGVIINTGGGVAGGDRVNHTVILEEGASVTLATQAAERIYRSVGRGSEIRVEMRLGKGACLNWLPQETILYSHAGLTRCFEVDMAACAALLMAEITVYGRKEMGEAINHANFSDRWRIRRGGRLAFAESIRFCGDLGAELVRPAIGQSARVTGTLLYVQEAAQDRLPEIRSSLSNATSRAAASAWNGLLCIRSLGTDLEAVRQDLSRAIVALRHQPMPRVWGT